jgi:hypothetical protein
VREKTREKIQASWDNKQNWSNRQFLSHMGLLFFASSVLRIPVAKAYHAMKQHAQISRELIRDERRLDEKAVLWEGKAAEQLHEWTRLALENKEVTPMDLNKEYEHFMMVDASAEGVGGVCYCPELNLVRILDVRWKRPAQSCDFESEGIDLALRCFFPQGTNQNIFLLNDNEAAVLRWGKGYAKSYNVNRHIAANHDTFEVRNMHTAHVAGVENTVADAGSRGGFLLKSYDPRELREHVEMAVSKARGGSRLNSSRFPLDKSFIRCMNVVDGDTGTRTSPSSPLLPSMQYLDATSFVRKHSHLREAFFKKEGNMGMPPGGASSPSVVYPMPRVENCRAGAPPPYRPPSPVDHMTF